MSLRIEAIYENGMLRPLEPLTLREHQRVTLVISDSSSALERSHHDKGYADELKEEQKGRDAAPSIEEILQLTGCDQFSWAEAISKGREERF